MKQKSNWISTIEHVNTLAKSFRILLYEQYNIVSCTAQADIFNQLERSITAKAEATREKGLNKKIYK